MIFLDNNKLIERHKIIMKIVDLTHNSGNEIYDAYSEWFYFKKNSEDSLEENEIEKKQKNTTIKQKHIQRRNKKN